MTAEPRDVEDLVPRDVEEIAALVRRVQSLPNAAAELVAREFVEARLAAADRENAELRGEVERLHELVRANAHAVLTFERERNSARAQLAAAQARLAEARSERDRVGEWINRYKAEQEVIIARYMARLEAVRAACDAAASDPDESEWVLVADVRAALSAASQPEPDPVVSEPATSWHVAPDTPDLMAALRVSVEEAKKRWTASDGPARCTCGEAVTDLRAALSAASQPEPEVGETLRVYRERARGQATRCDCGHSGMRHGPEMGCIECRCPLDGVR